jgi:hypothetical protein
MSKTTEHQDGGEKSKVIAASTALGIISGLIGIYVFFKDEITAQLFPDQVTATKADIKEQLQLSEERISAVVAASIADAISSAQARGTDISQDEKVDYEAALTKLLTSDDPALTDAKFLAVAGDAEAAANNIVATVSKLSDENDSVEEKSRADLLLSAGDILVPSDPKKALAAYEQALALDPGNQVLATRVQNLRKATAPKNEALAITDAAFELGGLKFEFQGCDQPEAPRCVFTVMNPTPQPIGLNLSSRQWAIDENSFWVQAGGRKIIAKNSDYWEVPSLEASQIELRFRDEANKFQIIRPSFQIDGVSFEKEFRNIAIRGGKQIEARSLRPVDSAHPEYAYEIAGVKIHFLGCTSADAPICRFDMMNEGKKDVNVEGRGAAGYTSEGVLLNSAKSLISLQNKRDSTAPPGIAFSWEIAFNREAGLFQSFWPDLRINGQAYPHEFRDILIAAAAPPIKTPRFEQAASPDASFDIAGLKFVFLGCRNSLTPMCTFDVQNSTDRAVLVEMRRPEATTSDGATYNSNSDVLEMSSANTVKFPAGITTTYDIAFRQEMSNIEKLSLTVYVDGTRYQHDLTGISVQ